jgi:hypothetical protein
LAPSALTAREDCVRGENPGAPARTARQLAQLQFHWGNPPPAPEPRILIRIAFSASRRRGALPSFRVFLGAHYAPSRRGRKCGKITFSLTTPGKFPVGAEGASPRFRRFLG